jgi:hypothetical protein
MMYSIIVLLFLRGMDQNQAVYDKGTEDMFWASVHSQIGHGEFERVRVDGNEMLKLKRPIHGHLGGVVYIHSFGGSHTHDQ